MEETLKALIVEDSEDDAQLLLRELRRGGYAVTFERVENAEQMAAALTNTAYDIVLADYSLPRFDAPGALGLLKQSGIDIPFIIISGTVTDELAVTAMKAGAHDYLQKRNLKRLLPAVERELREAEQRAARREADEVLRLQARTLAEQAAILDQAHVMTRDLSGKITLWTPGMERLYGWSKTEAIGNVAHELLLTKFPKSLPEIEEELRRAGDWQGELVHITRDGREIVVASHWVLHRDPEGTPLAVLEVDNDITDRRRVEETLRDSEAQYRILFESNPHPMWVYDSKTLRFMAVNDAAVIHYGYSRDEFLGMTIKNIRDAEDIPALLATTAKDNAGFSSGSIWKHRKKDGSVIDVEITSHGIVFAGKRAQLVLAHDVSDRVKAQKLLQEKADELASMTQQLWQASKLATMGELAASIAHELNNPLATVSLRAETLLDQLAGDEPKQRSLEIIIGEVERMAKLVTNLLQFTRRNYRQVSTIDVQEEVTRSLELISYYLRNHKIEVVTEFQESLPPIIADRQQLRQVFLNIMTNASDAMPHGGTLTVRVRGEQMPPRTVIEFADTGHGIAAKDLEKIWEPFYTSKDEGKGTGLGLSICSRIVEEHGGTIVLESEIGKGTTVRVTLPVAVESIAFENKSELSLTPSVSPAKKNEPQTASASKIPKARAVAQGSRHTRPRY